MKIAVFSCSTLVVFSLSVFGGNSKETETIRSPQFCGRFLGGVVERNNRRTLLNLSENIITDDLKDCLCPDQKLKIVIYYLDNKIEQTKSIIAESSPRFAKTASYRAIIPAKAGSIKIGYECPCIKCAVLKTE